MGRIAGILSLEAENGISQLDALQKVGSEIAMHIVAAKPLFLTKEFVSSDALNNEREILRSQVPVIPFSVASTFNFLHYFMEANTFNFLLFDNLFALLSYSAWISNCLSSYCEDKSLTCWMIDEYLLDLDMKT